jgi:broad specificity phosphatase PhoE
MKRTWWMLLLLIATTWMPLYAEGTKPTTVILLRHAEKMKDQTDNPSLSVAGQLRAQHLAFVLGQAGITAIYTSQFDRTKQTAQPLADLLKIKPVEVNADFSDKLVEEILGKHAGERVLVVGHSDTVPEIIGMLGAKAGPIEDSEYDNLYVVTVIEKGNATAINMKYGEPSK